MSPNRGQNAMPSNTSEPMNSFKPAQASFSMPISLDKAGLVARQRARRSSQSRGQSPRFRHCRHLPGLAPDRRCTSRDRYQQRVAYAPFQYPRAAMGRFTPQSPRMPEVCASRNCFLKRGLRNHPRSTWATRRHPHRRYGGRPAKCSIRAGVFHPW